ncbi:flagellar hook-basal body complex protein [Teredinibacter franksiae]|uniref:flagellar hook-basal body complex protein n=1 Tax=Teredinibacter franksiae TaxID=2761453 RepID=UPI00162602CD|nr:flagellar hook-basal body complex protein [Teredinibacter franksiae]
MLQSLFNGLSGMLSFSKGIEVISQNISNMNTPGYKAKNALYQEVLGSQYGAGSDVAGTAMQQQNGDFQDAGSPTTLAIDGSGFFILRGENGENYYTRAGQFQLNEEYMLVDSATGKYEVMALSEAGVLEAFSFEGNRVRPPVATSEVQLAGNISSDEGEHRIDDLYIYDIAGESHRISIELINDDAGSWTVNVLDENESNIGSGSVAFDTDGSPLEGSSSAAIEIPFAGGQTVEFNLGEPGSFENATQFVSGATNLGATVTDGGAASGYISLNFDNDGVLNIEYGNGEEEEGARIALANFNDVTKLSQSGSFYQAGPDVRMIIGNANEGVNGKVLGGKLELSNTELTEQFAQLLVSQQGYTASSRVMNVANQLIETLYSSTGGR